MLSNIEYIPIPGVEPGPSDGKSPILTARLYRIVSYLIGSYLILLLGLSLYIVLLNLNQHVLRCIPGNLERLTRA